MYRHERRKIRDEKMKVLNTKVLDPVSKEFDLNCLRVLASRYLFRNNKNEIYTLDKLFDYLQVNLEPSILVSNIFVSPNNEATYKFEGLK